MQNNNELVLVTGANGFVGSHVVKKLIDEGYRVRATIRSLKDEKKIAPLKELAKNSKHELELAEADLLNEQSWINAVKGCDYVMHTASPVPNYVPNDENELIKPAVNGTLFVLKACVQEGSKVRRVILTSSLAAIAGDEFKTGHVYSEADFVDVAKSHPQPYTKSKILAEKSAWEFVEDRKKNNLPCFELVSINPGYICGPIFHGTFSSSMEPVKRLMLHEMPVIPDLVLPSCDVRDVAEAHVKCLKLDEAVNKRFMIVSNFDTLLQNALWLKEEFGSKGYNIPTRVAPNFLLKIYGLFDKTVAFVCPILGKRPVFNNDRFKNVLKINPIDSKKSVIDMAYSMIEKGYIPKKF